MRHFRSFLPLLFLALLYSGCQKSDTTNHSSTSLATKPTTTTINVPENVTAKTITTDSLITDFQRLAVLLNTPNTITETDGSASPLIINPINAVYEGYTKTYSCSTNTWTYVFNWLLSLTNAVSQPSGSGSLTVGTTTVSAPFTVVGTIPPPGPPRFYIQYTVSINNDDNYCNSTTLQEMVSFSYNLHTIPGAPPRTASGAASNTESADPNVYQTYSDLVGGFSPNGDGTFTLDVVPGVTVCGTACHTSALGFPPTVIFYYSPVGSTTWQSFSQAGDDLNEFFIQLPAAGTYQYYTQEDTAPGVLSGELSSGTITVQ